ncbi:hypothetical protein SAMN05444422_10712 [Halobiforma haloterrestris]|uniref:Uncharacterized protein n=2 Tax=Natronobacterium TaxID=2256 RepID=M0LJU9_NATLA|nr:hypothetical protein C445_11147 [Halobiforma lacisalsi AJ5]SFC32568.1 hypothetical protein SAMN05444422_10712 [Halobiforma haloterrestris]
MSRTIKILLALVAVVVLWKVVFSGSDADVEEIEYEPTE